MPQVGRKLFRRSIDVNLSDYPHETSIHGIKYLANRSRPLPDRIFWIIIFILSTSCLGYFVYKIGRTWMEHAVMITDRTKPINIFEIPFPAITICPQIKIKHKDIDFWSLADNDTELFANYSDYLRSDFGRKYAMASQICRESFQQLIWLKINSSISYADPNELYSMHLPNDWIKILRDVSPNFDDVFDKCEMMRLNTYDHEDFLLSKRNCKLLFSTILTNEGICFTLNTIGNILRTDSLQTNFRYHNIMRNQDGWDPEQGYTNDTAYPFKGIVKGALLAPRGLKFVLNANMSDVNPFCSPRDAGYKIVLHSPSAYPQTYDNSISLEYGKEYEIAVTPKTIKTNDNLRSFTPEERRCFFNDERKLKFYTYYNKENCQLECYSNYMEHFYGGVPFSSPRNSNTTNYMLPHINYGWDLIKYFELAYEYTQAYDKPKKKLFTELYTMIFNCNCLPACNTIHYGTTVLKSHNDFSKEAESDEGNLKIIQTTIEIVFNEPTFIGQQRVPVYTFETMIAEFGGLLGLFMGGSVLSLFELLYFLTIRNCFKPTN